MLSADAHLEVFAHLSCPLYSDFNKLADTRLVNCLKGVIRKNPSLKVFRQKPSQVIAGKPKAHLGQVIGAKRKELRGFGDFTRKQRSAGYLNHCAKGIRNLFKVVFL